MKITIFAISLALCALSTGVQGGKLSSIFGHKNGNNDATTTPDYGTAFSNMVLAYQRILPCGFAPWNLPPLAPYTAAEWSFDFHKAAYGLNGTMTNIVVTGLDNFRAMQYDYDASTGKTTFDFIYYDVQLLAEYTVNAWAMVAGFNATLVGDGPMNWKLKDARLMGDYVIGTNPSNPNGLAISNFNINVLVGDVIDNSWNNQWDISFNNFQNRWFREFLLMWVQENQEAFVSMYDAWVLPDINNAIANVSMTELVAFFVEQTDLMNAQTCNPSQSTQC